MPKIKVKVKPKRKLRTKEGKELHYDYTGTKCRIKGCDGIINRLNSKYCNICLQWKGLL